jgi:hypothetical protein
MFLRHRPYYRAVLQAALQPARKPREKGDTTRNGAAVDMHKRKNAFIIKPSTYYTRGPSVFRVWVTWHEILMYSQLHR